MSRLDDLKRAEIALTAILLQVHGDVANPDGGLCEEFNYRTDGLTITDFVDWSEWEHFSGIKSHPVPYGISDTQTYLAYLAEPRWDKSTQYGRMRIDLTEWCLRQVEKQIRKLKGEIMRKEDLKSSIVIARSDVIEHLENLCISNTDDISSDDLALYIYSCGTEFRQLKGAHKTTFRDVKYLTPDQVLSVPLPEKKKVTLELTDDQLNQVKQILEQEQK